jgi:hypothetical protein
MGGSTLGRRACKQSEGIPPPEAPTVPLILTPGPQPENPFALKKPSMRTSLGEKKIELRGKKWRRMPCARSPQTDRDPADSYHVSFPTVPTNPGKPRQNRPTPELAASDFLMNEAPWPHRLRSCLSKQCSASQRGVGPRTNHCRIGNRGTTLGS